MDSERLEQAVAEYGTPLYLFDLDEAMKKICYFREKMSEKTGLCYAMKANSFLTREMSEWIDRIEVCSTGEFEICRRLRVPQEKLLISGVRKKKEELEVILDACGSKCRYTAESAEQFKIYAEWGKVHGERLPVFLRLTSGNQFGMDEETIEKLIASRDRFPWVKICGLHYFSGTQKKTSDKFKKEITYLDEFLGRLEEKYGFEADELEYGPGVAVPYFKNQRDTTDEDAEVLKAACSSMKWKGSVTLEMGRALAASSGYYAVGVCECKQNHGTHYCIVDGGLHQMNYDGQLLGMYEPECSIHPAFRSGEYGEWTICGSLCTVNDVLVRKLILQNPQIGDSIIFKNTGAYAMTEGMALFLSHELPAVVLYSKKDGFKIARKKQETYQWNMEDMNHGNLNEYFNGNGQHDCMG